MIQVSRIRQIWALKLYTAIIEDSAGRARTISLPQKWNSSEMHPKQAHDHDSMALTEASTPFNPYEATNLRTTKADTTLFWEMAQV